MSKYIVIQGKIHKVSELIEDFFTIINLIIILAYFLDLGDRGLLLKYFIVIMIINSAISLITSNLIVSILKRLSSAKK